MDIKEKAKLFAIKAHKGQIRKSELDKPMIMHPISVGMLLEKYGYDENIVAAGYLHDVVEDTKYTIEDIKQEFGEDIASLVMGASEIDKSLSWEERKKQAIETIKTLPLRNKLVICADKINNLEDLKIIFEKNGQRDFSAFNRGEDQQKWYYTNIYKSLIFNGDENLPIFKRLKEALSDVFEFNDDLFLKDVIFKDNEKRYQKLKKLHAEKVELQRLKSLCNLSKPFVIEFTGTPRTGKTTTIENLYDFFKKGGFDVLIIEELTTSKYYKNDLIPKFSKMNSADRNIAILKETYNQLLEALNKNSDIILIDRSINDRQIWNYRSYINQNMDEQKYLETKEKFSKISKELIDFFVVTYAEPLESLKRDYNCHLALEKRSFLNIDNIKEFNESLDSLKDLFRKSVNDYCFLDTTSMDISDVSSQITSQIMPVMRKKYIKTFENKYKL